MLIHSRNSDLKLIFPLTINMETHVKRFNVKAKVKIVKELYIKYNRSFNHEVASYILYYIYLN